MEIREVKKQIQAKRLDNFYLFTGEEVEAQRLYVEKMAEVTGRELTRVECVADALKRRGGGLMASRPRLYVVRDDRDFMQSEKAWESVEDLLGDNVLILQITAVDKRTRFYNHYADRIVTFNHMTADVLSKYAYRACPLNEQNLDRLITCCSADYGKVLLEANKINNFASSEGVSVDLACDTLMSEGTISKPPQEAVFDFADAVLQAKPNRAYRLLQDCKAVGSSTLGLISALYTSARRVLQVQACESKDVAEVTGLSAWEIRKARESVGFWDSVDLVRMLKSCQWTEQAIKTGQIEEPLAMDYLMTLIF